MAGMQPLSQGSLLRWIGENPRNEVGPVWSTTIALKQILPAKEVYLKPVTSSKLPRDPKSAQVESAMFGFSS